MRSSGISILTFCLAVLLAGASLQAQPPQRPSGERGPQRNGRDNARPSSGERQSRQKAPWVQIFDTDNDGELSRSEIESGTASLWKLDRNNDGKISGSELRPASGSPGQQARRGQGEQGSGPPQREGAGQGRSGGRQGGGRGGDPAKADSDFARQLMTLDSNGNGVIELVELPDHMHDAFQIADADNSESLNEKELLALASKFRRNELNPDQTQQRQNEPTGGRREQPGN